MNFTPANTLLAVVVVIALIWKLAQLIRTPHDVPLRTVVAFLVTVGVGLLFTGNGGEHHWFGIPAMTWATLHYALQMAAMFLLALFFVQASNGSRRQAWLTAVPFVLAVAAQTILAFVIPPNITNNDHYYPAVSWWFIVFSVYTVVILLFALFPARRYARTATGLIRRGLQLICVGVALLATSGLLLGVANIPFLLGKPSPDTLIQIGALTTSIGVISYLTGICYPGVVQRWHTTRLWFQHRRGYHQLAPLWHRLNVEFPEVELSRAPAGRSAFGGFLDRVSAHNIHRRFYRRVVECRDGLVRISPYLDDKNDLPAALESALRKHAGNGQPNSGRAVALAVPETGGFEADAGELLALAAALPKVSGAAQR